jgi:hypothetical protein
MNHFYIYQNEKQVDEVIVTADTDVLTAFANWLDDNEFEGKYEMIQTNDGGNLYAEVGKEYFEIMGNSKGEIKECMIQHLDALSNDSDDPFYSSHVNDFRKEIEECSDDSEAVEKVYEWERESLGFRSRGETRISYLYQEMYKELSRFLP